MPTNPILHLTPHPPSKRSSHAQKPPPQRQLRIRIHLTSPVVAILPLHIYTLSVYARSNAPAAKLRLSLWTHPLDFDEAPDYASPPMPLTDT